MTRLKHKEINIKIKQLKTEQLLDQTFSTEKLRQKSHQNVSAMLLSS